MMARQPRPSVDNLLLLKVHIQIYLFIEARKSGRYISISTLFRFMQTCMCLYECRCIHIQYIHIHEYFYTQISKPAMGLLNRSNPSKLRRFFNTFSVSSKSSNKLSFNESIVRNFNR